MPELPEVQAVARTLRPFLKGRKIRSVHVLHAVAVKPQTPGELARIAEGQRISDVSRQGKYLLVILASGLLTMHFRLDGQLVWFANGREFLARANARTDGVHVDVALELDRGVLGFADRGHFGRAHAWRSPEECGGLRRLGVDALSKRFTANCLFELLRGSQRPLKEFLLEQKFVAGIGNIYSCESLWHARLNPRRRANSVLLAEARRLHKAIVSVLVRALECCLHPAPNFRDAQWWFQGLEGIVRVYGREGQPCRRCGELVERIAQGGRSTYYCKSCQQ